jgi:DNA-directed RNA polymerase specialized sigma24 family protein
MDDQLVEDAVMFAWEQLVRRGLPDYSQVLGWLVTVATHEAWAMSRRRGREAGDEPLFFAESRASDPHAQAEARDQVAHSRG